MRNKRKLLWTFTIVIVLCAVHPSWSQWSEKSNSWGKHGSVAVVNPAVRSTLEQQNVMSLSGEWDFIYGEQAVMYPLGVGDPGWGSRPYDWSSARKIQVPGCWESQGVGEPGDSISWNCKWDCGDWELRHIYMGTALYRKTVEIPQNWTDSQIWLKIGGVRSDAYIRVNGQRAAYVYNYCGTEKYNITDLIIPGETNEITAIVRNDIPSRKGLYAANHRFGGFYRDIELEATKSIYLDDAWVRGDFDKNSAETHIRIGDSRDKDLQSSDPISGEIIVTIRSIDGEPIAEEKIAFDSAGEKVISIPIANIKNWTPEEPNLYLAEIVLCDSDKNPTQGRVERFGVRKLEVIGKQFYLNGKPYFLRGAGDHHYDAYNIIEPPDRDRFIAQMKLYKSAGFNAMRHHTHAPLPEYFEAADEIGMLLQPELPYYHDVPTEGAEFDPMRDTVELVQNYRHYTSFAIISGGNEGYWGKPIDEEVYRWVKTNDSDRLMIQQDGGRNLPTNSDFATGGIPDYCGALIRPWEPGKFDYLERPFVAHEYLNLAIRMDPHLEPRFTGVRVSPVSMEKYLEQLNLCGLTEAWGDACITAMEKLQSFYQKQGLEAARIDPQCDGYYFWSIADASIPQGSTVAAQGYLNTFHETRKDGLSPQEFYRFNGPTTILLETNLDPMIVTSGETVDAKFHISHYSSFDIPEGELSWKLVNLDDESVIVDGKIPHKSLHTGFAGLLGNASISIPELHNPVRAELRVSLGDSIRNQWAMWLFPQREKRSLKGIAVSPELASWFRDRYTDVSMYGVDEIPTDCAVIIRADDTENMDSAISNGRRILAISSTTKEPNVSLGWWSIGTQVGTAFADHPVFGDFPTARWMDPLWFRMVRRGAWDLAKSTPFGRLEPLAIGVGRDSYYMYMGQAKVMLDSPNHLENNDITANLLATSAIEILQDTPEAAWLLDNIIQYLLSDQFSPETVTTIPKSIVSVPDGMTLGFGRVLRQDCESGIWFSYCSENEVQYLCRQTAIGNTLEWETSQTQNEPNVESVTYIFAGGLGYAEQANVGGMELLLNGDPVGLQFDSP